MDADRTIQPFYDSLAGQYHLMFADWWESARDQGARLCRILTDRGVPPASTILDCACGIGTQALGLAALGYAVTGTDVSSVAIERSREEAARRRIAFTARVADMRRLDEQPLGVFDAVVCCDNAVPHLLSRSDLDRALRAIRCRTRPGGLFVASIRDYDGILADRPTGTVPRVFDDKQGRRIVFQLWSWAGDTDIYDLELFVLMADGTSWVVSHATTRYRAMRRAELTQALVTAGFLDPVWTMPAESDYYQPLVTARAGTGQSGDTPDPVTGTRPRPGSAG
jgi:SAM-dependent methyltransferase